MGENPSRRDVLRAAAAACAGLALSHGSARAAPAVKLVKVTGPGVRADIALAVKKSLEPLGGMAAFVKPGARVLLKPNMGFATEPHIRATTSPEVVAAVAREVLACKPSRVLIADHPMRHPEVCREKNGIAAACRGLDTSVVLPTEARQFVEREIPRGLAVRKVAVLKEALEADVHIALPVAKSHMAAGFSGGVKGHMGLIFDRESFHSAYELNQAIADLATLLPVQLTLLDAVDVLASGGPAGPGEVVPADTLVAGTDIVAVDAVGVGLVKLYRRNIKPAQVKHLRTAAEMGVGLLELPPEQVIQLQL